MRLAAKLTAAVALVLIVAMALFDLHLVRQEVRLYDADLKRAGHIGRAFTLMVETVWRKRGDNVTRRLVERSSGDLDRSAIRLDWTALDDPDADTLVPDSIRAELVRGQTLHTVDEEAGLQTWYAPMENKDGRQAVLVYVESYHDVLHLIRTTHRDIAITTIFILLGVTGATLLLGYWFVGRPIARLRALAGQLGEGERIAPVALRQNDEIGTLANEFDRMAGRLAEETERRQHAVDQLRHTDRLTTVGQLASGVAHELGTPLNVVSGHAELIADGELDAAQAARSARVIVEQTDAMARLIRQLLSLARRTPMEREVLDLRDVALRTVNTLEPLAKQQRVPLSVTGPTGVAYVFAEPAHLQQALMNVVVNAIQATPAGQPVRIAVSVREGARPDEERTAGPTSYATISVLDRGPGIPDDRLPYLFEPFFTTKPAGEGTGLGLPVTDGIVRDHGGWVEVANETGAGACFTFWLPLAESLGQAAYA